MKFKPAIILLTALVAIAVFCLFKINENYKFRKEIASTFRQFILACQVYPNNSDSVWPTDMKLLLKSLPEIKSDISSGDIEMMLDENRIIYVRPVPNATSDQPVFVSNPEVYSLNESVVGYADGHVDFAKGNKIWLAGKRLAGYAGIHDDDKGIKKFDWKVELEK